MRLVGQYLADGSVEVRDDSTIVYRAGYQYIDSVVGQLTSAYGIAVVNDTATNGIIEFTFTGSILHPSMSRSEKATIIHPPFELIENGVPTVRGSHTTKETLEQKQWKYRNYVEAVDITFLDGEGRRQLGKIMIRRSSASTVKPSQVAKAIAKYLQED